MPLDPTMWRACEPQASASHLPGGRVEHWAEEAQTLPADRAAAADLDRGEPGVGAGLCARCGGVRASDPGAERGGCVHAGVLGLGSRYELRQPKSDTGAGANCGRARAALGDPLRQRSRTDQSAFTGVVRGAADRVSAHSAREADAERTRGELSRTAARRVLDRELVSEPVRCAAQDRRVEDRLQRSKTAQQFGIPDAEGVCYSDESG